MRPSNGKPSEHPPQEQSAGRAHLSVIGSMNWKNDRIRMGEAWDGQPDIR